MTQPDHKRDWWARWFNETYSEVYLHRDLPSARAEVKFCVERLGLGPDRSVLDLCCGGGRHYRALAEAGIRSVTGLDYSRDLLRQARLEHQAGNTLRGDMRALPYRTGAFDAVVMFFTSFGYFASEREDRAVLREIARVLRPGGAYLIDFLNPAHVRATLEPQSERTLGGRRVMEERTLSKSPARVEKKITIETNGTVEEFHESVRLYEMEELRTMLAETGLPPSAVVGDFSGANWNKDQPRTIFMRALE